MIDLNNPETSFAIETVRLASQLVKQVRAELVSPALTKEDRSPVTIADYASQALVAYRLAKVFPEDVLVAEEDAHALRTSEAASTLELVTKYVSRFTNGATQNNVADWIDRGAAQPQNRFWVLDPIDGTKGFLRGDQYAVALALIVNGQVQLGVLGCPELADGFRPHPGGAGSLAAAVRGHGTWVTDATNRGSYNRLTVSNQSDPAQARLLRSVEAGHTNVDQVDDLRRGLGANAKPVRMDSQAKYVVLAAGGGEIMVRLLSPSKMDYREKIWDQAAGSIVLEEAGGQISDLDGNPLDFRHGRTLAHNRGIIASNGALHQAAIDVLKRIGA